MPKIKSPREYLLPEEIRQIVKYCKRREDALLIEFVYDTGCRISEALQVTPDDIDYEAGIVRLPALKRKKLTYKLVTLSDGILPKLRQFAKGKKPQQRLWPLSRQLAYYRLRMAAMDAGIDGAYLHLLRDSFATQWAKAGGDLVKLSRQLGHASPVTTLSRYIRYSTADIKEERERLFKE